MATDSLGLYVHIPYCVRKCNYCDFCSLSNGRDGVPNTYVSALCAEISSYKSVARETLDTVYFGGGTPSLLSLEQMEKIFSVIRDTFDIAFDAELTFEANPGTLTAEKACAFKTIGFNRVSLGLQSIHKNEMKKLGRIHNYSDFLSSFRTLRDVGFDNINVDLMYGIPYQTLESFAETLRAVSKLGPEHISAYGLILEEGTPLFLERESLIIPTQDEECDMYELACKMLADCGYEHYEISNYAKPGKRSRHNLLYWNFKSYIGVGASAHSFFGGKRFCNTDDVGEYISSSGVLHHIEEETDLPFEYAMLKLRLSDGLSFSEYKKMFKKDFISGNEEKVSHLAKEGLISFTDEGMSLTERGFYLSNSILIEIL